MSVIWTSSYNFSSEETIEQMRAKKEKTDIIIYGFLLSHSRSFNTRYVQTDFVIKFLMSSIVEKVCKRKWDQTEKEKVLSRKRILQ